MKNVAFSSVFQSLTLIICMALFFGNSIAREGFNSIFNKIKRYDKSYNTNKIKTTPEIVTVIAPRGIKKQEVKDSFPKPKNGNTYVIAHRGAHSGIPENTLAAFQKAIDLGCDFVEIDTRKTKDGRIVSVHNSTVDAYVDEITGKVGDFTLAELKAMDIGSRVGPEWKNERIPTVEEILQLCSGQIGIYLDLKENLVPELVELKKYNMERDVVWYIPASFMEAIKQVQDNCPKCQPMPDPGPAKNIAKVAKEVQPHVIATDMGELNTDYMKIAHENNLIVFVDEDKGNAKEWGKILDWGTEGIQTDKPEELIKFLNGNK